MDALMICGGTIQACRDRRYRGIVEGNRPAVFLDRDGTLIVDRPYSADPGAIEVLPGVVDGLSALHEAGYLLVVVTNQSGIARGYFDEAALWRMHLHLDRLLRRRGVPIATYYYCPHHVDGVLPDLKRRCGCRKPGAGMLHRASRDWGIHLGRSWLIGDMPTDLAAAATAGCRSILVGDRPAKPPIHRVRNLSEAAAHVLRSDQERRVEIGPGLSRTRSGPAVRGGPLHVDR